jgi:hypothetical protein
MATEKTNARNLFNTLRQKWQSATAALLRAREILCGWSCLSKVLCVGKNPLTVQIINTINTLSNKRIFAESLNYRNICEKWIKT